MDAGVQTDAMGSGGAGSGSRIGGGGQGGANTGGAGMGDPQAPAGGRRTAAEEPAGAECRLWQTDDGDERSQDDHEQRG